MGLVHGTCSVHMKERSKGLVPTGQLLNSVDSAQRVKGDSPGYQVTIQTS